MSSNIKHLWQELSHIFLDNKLFENVLNHVEKDLFITKKLFSNKNNKRKK